MNEALFVLILLFVVLITFTISDFVIAYKKESSYVKMEISRSCTRSEKLHWQHELKRLRKRYFPFLYLFEKKQK